MNGSSSILTARFGGSDVSRRDFLKVCTIAAGALGLPAQAAEKMAEKAASGAKPSVVWLHFQECTGCSESLLRTSHPDVAELILDLISLDYHETLFAAAGHQAEEALRAAMEKNLGKFVCVVEGAIPMKDDGIYCMVGGRTAVDILTEVAGKAAAVISIGSCASWGGVPSSGPNPTQAVGAAELLKAKGINKPVVNLPGCPANPYNLIGTVLQFATFGTLPALDAQGRPKFAYARVIHEDCPRRPHFDAGRFAEKFGDAGHRDGYCLYKLGCKGPVTHANCSINSFCEVPGAWPIGIGAPCFGCTEKGVVFAENIFDTVKIEHPTAPAGVFTEVAPETGRISPLATGVAGIVGGALIGAGVIASRKLNVTCAADEHEEKKP